MFLERERKRDRDIISLILAENAYSTFVLFTFPHYISKKKKIIKEKTSSQVNHVKTILTFRDIKSMYFYGSEDFSKVNKVSSTTFSMLFALILWNFEIPLFPQISSGFVPANVQRVLGLTNIENVYPCKEKFVLIPGRFLRL